MPVYTVQLAAFCLCFGKPLNKNWRNVAWGLFGGRVEKTTMKILIVDDESEIVDELRGFLERRGHKVTGAEGVEQACAALGGGETFDVVVTDMRMPPGSGVEVVSACSRLPAPPAVVLMTGQASQTDVDDAMSAGARSILWKPLSLRKVMEALTAASASMATPNAA